MDKQQIGTTNMTPSSDDIDALLGGLELDEDAGAATEVVEEAAVEEIPAELDDGALAAVELAEAREEAYAEQTVDADGDVDLDAKTASEPAASAPAKVKKAAGPKKPAVERDLSALSAENFVLEMDDASGDLEANKTAVIASKPAQKKIAEKFDNLFTSLAAGRAPSVYVMDCFKVLDDKKEVTSADLIAALKVEGYTQGTAASQAGQVMTLFPKVKIATRAGSTLKLNDQSTIAAALRALATTAAPASP